MELLLGWTVYGLLILCIAAPVPLAVVLLVHSVMHRRRRRRIAHIWVTALLLYGVCVSVVYAALYRDYGLGVFLLFAFIAAGLACQYFRGPAEEDRRLDRRIRRQRLLRTLAVIAGMLLLCIVVGANTPFITV